MIRQVGPLFPCALIFENECDLNVRMRVCESPVDGSEWEIICAPQRQAMSTLCTVQYRQQTAEKEGEEKRRGAKRGEGRREYGERISHYRCAQGGVQRRIRDNGWINGKREKEKKRKEEERCVECKTFSSIRNAFLECVSKTWWDNVSCYSRISKYSAKTRLLHRGTPLRLHWQPEQKEKMEQGREEECKGPRSSEIERLLFKLNG